jgi:hypothetical protein
MQTPDKENRRKTTTLFNLLLIEKQLRLLTGTKKCPHLTSFILPPGSLCDSTSNLMADFSFLLHAEINYHCTGNFVSETHGLECGFSTRHVILLALHILSIVFQK